MTFFSRPNLEDVQFRQISGSTLTLSGITKIASVTGLRLYNGVDGYVPINLNGAGSGTTNFSLVYDHTINSVVLRNVSGGTAMYEGNPVSTIKLGGVEEGTTLTGRTLTSIIEELLTPTQEPELVSPTMTFTINPSGVQEIGQTVSILGTSSLNRGTASPHYDSNGNNIGISTPLSGLPNTYTYSGSLESGVFTVSSNSISNSRTITPIIQPGSNTWISCISYDAGVDIYDSSGNVFHQESAGFLVSQRSFSGILPYYYGKISSGGAIFGSNRPEITEIVDCINSINVDAGTDQNFGSGDGNKVSAVSTGTITITYNSTNDDYIWFAVPATSPIKTVWFVDLFNSSTIGGPAIPGGGNLFPDPELVTTVVSSIWDNASGTFNKNYNVYLSNGQSPQQQIQFRNS